MIITITLNPALDVSGTVDKLIPDEKSYVRDEITTPGGNGVNAAIIAHRLDAHVLASGFLGGSNGEELKSLLDKLKLPHAFIPIEGKTRMNLTVSNKANHKQTRLSFPGPGIKPLEMEELEFFVQQISNKDLVVFGGSLPPNVSAAYVGRLIKDLKQKGNLCLVDMPGKVLTDIIKNKPDFIKPNLTEFQEMVGKKVKTIKSILPLVRELNKNIPLVCVSSVEGGAILVSKTSAWYGKIPRVKIRSTVGAGDSMVGAIMSRLHKDPETPVEELLRWGLAASCATLSVSGMVLGSKSAIVAYYPKIIMRELK